MREAHSTTARNSISSSHYASTTDLSVKVSIAEGFDSTTTLVPTIGITSGIGILMSCLMSAENFLIPGSVWQLTGSVGMSFIMWAVGAIMHMFGGLCYVELGLMLPQSGGEKVYLSYCYRYPRELLGYAFSWIMILVMTPANLAAQMVIFGQYILYAATGDAVIDEAERVRKDWMARGIGIAGLAIIVALNTFSMRWANRVHNVLTLGKIMAKLLIIGLGLAVMTGGLDIPDTGNWDEPFAGTSTNALDYALASLRVGLAFCGWGNLNYAISEVKRPERTLPISILSSITLGAALMLLLNAAYTVTLPASVAFAAQEVIVGTFGAATLGAVAGQVLIPILLAVVAFGAASASILVCSRVLHEAARSNYLPGWRFLSIVHVGSNTPRRCILANGILALIALVVPPPGRAFDFLVEVSGFSYFLYMGLAVLGLIIVRYTEPAKARPFKVWIIVPIIFTTYILITLVTAFLPPADGKVVDEYGITYFLPSVVSILFSLFGVPFWFVYVICNGSWRVAWRRCIRCA
ncbi:amino acid/polyamine transporter I [Thamnocephalis sphaerospora]|uniref:Amino acid/polyamine transporter I n=1 Tax=Thamnocephalis sphaerospora TaxID=78915 RepID=A0A4P9XTI4_9FUNG|nr:amino acid/polyamine transporter I [Thamnocephalis sphaerospora]|eukprot:RKP09494.1 amino acid/polyamine transporter I [Thamnocephalis sphaerospora]